MTADLPKLESLRAYTKGVFVRKADVTELIRKHAAAHHRKMKVVGAEEHYSYYWHELKGARDAVLKLAGLTEKELEGKKNGGKKHEK